MRVAADSLMFDLRRLAGTMAADPSTGDQVPAERLHLEAAGKRRRGRLALESLSGRRAADSVQVERWQGKLYLGQAD